MIWFGGIRGAITIALSMELPSEWAGLMTATAFMFVIFTVVVSASLSYAHYTPTMHPLYTHYTPTMHSLSAIKVHGGAIIWLMKLLDIKPAEGQDVKKATKHLGKRHLKELVLAHSAAIHIGDGKPNGLAVKLIEFLESLLVDSDDSTDFGREPAKGVATEDDSTDTGRQGAAQVDRVGSSSSSSSGSGDRTLVGGVLTAPTNASKKKAIL
jgi:hypothetical protein